MIDLSVIVPAYRAKGTAEASAKVLHAFLTKAGRNFEIILVDDGSEPGQRPDLGGFPATCRLVQLEQNRGKGAAVKAGLSAAVGRVVCFFDVDLPFELECLTEAYRLIDSGEACFVAGDRQHPLSQTQTRVAWPRQVLSFLFAYTVSRFLSRPVSDTQCGFKAMTNELWTALIPLTHVDRFAFDVEWYEIFAVNGLEPRRIPVTLRPSGASSVSFLREAGRTFRDLTKLFWRSRLNRYCSAEVRRIAVSGAGGGGDKTVIKLSRR
jgi:dolichyl-phosphate beta-glucosyltransferase